MAARGTRAAASDAGDWAPHLRSATNAGSCSFLFPAKRVHRQVTVIAGDHYFRGACGKGQHGSFLR
jgi:hypothetical protein